MPPKFQPQARSRFIVTPFTPERMGHLGDVLIQSIQERLDRGETVADGPAWPLTPGYARWKAIKFPRVETIRNLRASSITRDTIRTLSSGDNRALIGSTDARANRILGYYGIRASSRRGYMWGVSRRNRRRIEREIDRMGVIRAGKA